MGWSFSLIYSAMGDETVTQETTGNKGSRSWMDTCRSNPFGLFLFGAQPGTGRGAGNVGTWQDRHVLHSSYPPPLGLGKAGAANVGRGAERGSFCLCVLVG